MKPNQYWQFRPYIPLNQISSAEKLYICRLAPFETGFEFEVLDREKQPTDFLVYIRIRGSEGAWSAQPFHGNVCRVEQLITETDYEFYVVRQEDPITKSPIRLVRTGFFPDTMVHYVHPDDDVYAFSGHYLCDPTFVRVPSGGLVAAMDLYAKEYPQNLEILFRSDDNGKTWRYLCDLIPAYWGTLFMHKNVLYMLCVSTENGHLMIGASYDEGYTWTRPVLLFVGGNTQKTNGFQRQPMPIIEHDGRLMTSLEFGSWNDPKRYGIGILSAGANDNLLDPQSWTLSDLTYYDYNWPGSPTGGIIALLEGSLYVAKDGKLLNLLRMQIDKCTPNHGKACLLEADSKDPEKAPSFHSIIDMPTGANSRTHILKDPVGGKYWGIGNLITDPEKPWMRNILALVVSDDGYSWHVAKLLLDYRHLDHKKVGFQYTSFIFDGDDILYLSRTSFNGAHSFHDANCQTFGVIHNFRMLT